MSKEKVVVGFRIDTEVKDRLEKLCKSNGTDLSKFLQGLTEAAAADPLAFTIHSIASTDPRLYGRYAFINTLLHALRSYGQFLTKDELDALQMVIRASGNIFAKDTARAVSEITTPQKTEV